MTMTNEDFIAHYGMTKDDAIAHFGVKGMKWGSRKASGDSGGSGGNTSTKAALKSLDKQTKAREKEAGDAFMAERAKAIDGARARQKTQRADLKAAKATYNRDKHVIGKRAAKNALRKVRAEKMMDNEMASELKDGKEVALAVVGIVGLTVLTGLLSGR